LIWFISSGTSGLIIWSVT